MAARAGRQSTRTVLVTGATGLVGSAVIARLLATDSGRIHAVVRSPARWAALAARLGADAARVIPVTGDVTVAGLALGAATRRTLGRTLTHVVHCAADTSFSRPLEAARAVNTAGTAHVLALAAEWRVARLVHVSTAFVAGARTGAIAETPLDGAYGFVNGYEQSKQEAELLVQQSGVAHVIARPSTIVCDDGSGRVTQQNAVHRALRMFHAGYAALVPGGEDSPVDLVTTEYVARGVVASLFARHAAGVMHLCAGAGALTLGELLDGAYAVWSRDAEWRRRGIARPALTELATYRLFERAVEQTRDARLCAITRSLSHFVPQLALPKRFETVRADALAGAAPPVRSFWPHVVEQLACTWRGGARHGVAA